MNLENKKRKIKITDTTRLVENEDGLFEYQKKEIEYDTKFIATIMCRFIVADYFNGDFDNQYDKVERFVCDLPDVALSEIYKKYEEDIVNYLESKYYIENIKLENGVATE